MVISSARLNNLLQQASTPALPVLLARFLLASYSQPLRKRLLKPRRSAAEELKRRQEEEEERKKSEEEARIKEEQERIRKENSFWNKAIKGIKKFGKQIVEEE